jgi:hypothetical protein
MSYNTQLQTNNETIQSLIDTVNALPDAPAFVEQATPTITVSTGGLIVASVTQDAGYVLAGTKNITKQLTTQAAKTVTPNTSSQTAVASGRYTTGTVTVAAIPSTYVKPTTKKSAATYTPTTSNQTIAAGTYCSGAQTIKGDANLVAGNIKSGVSIFGVTGTYAGTTEDLDAVITELETKTSTLNTTLEGKASGGGGSIETCTVTLSISNKAEPVLATGGYTIHYMNSDGISQQMSGDSGSTFIASKNSLVAIATALYHNADAVTTNAALLSAAHGVLILTLTGDTASIELK